MNEVDIERAGGATATQVRAARIMATAAQISARPRNTRVQLYGDSRAANDSYSTSTYAGRRTRGPLAWSLFRLRQSFDSAPHVNNHAVTGSTTQDAVAAMVANLETDDAGTVLLLSSTNDRTSGFTADGRTTGLDANGANTDTLHNLALMRDMVLASGRILILCAEMPRSGSNALSTTQGYYHERVRKFIIDQATVPGVFVVDTYTLGADMSQSTMAAKTAYLPDELHPNQLGAYYLFGGLDDVFRLLFPPRNLLPVGQFLATADNPTGCLTANPMMLGTGGTNSTSAVITGSVPTSYTISCTTGTGLAITSSIVTGSGGEKWWQLAIAGTASASCDITISQSAINDTYISTGGRVDGVMAVQVDAANSGLREVSMRINSSALGKNYEDMLAYDSTDTWPPVAHDGVVRVSPITLPPLAGQTLTPRAFVRTNPGTVSATVRLRAFAIRRLSD